MLQRQWKEKQNLYIVLLLEWSDSLLSFAVGFSFLLWINQLKFPTAFTRYFRVSYNNAHVLVIKDLRRKNDVKGEGGVSGPSFVFSTACPLILTTEPTGLYSCQFTPHSFRPGLYDSTRTHAILWQHIKAWALSSPTPQGYCSWDFGAVLTIILLLPPNTNLGNIVYRIPGFPIKIRFRISPVCQRFECSGC